MDGYTRRLVWDLNCTTSQEEDDDDRDVMMDSCDESDNSDLDL